MIRASIAALLLLGCSGNVAPEGSCNDVADPTTRVAMRQVVGTRPAAVGGTINDGVYETTDRIVYVTKPGTTTIPDSAERLIFRGNLISGATREPPESPTDHRNFTFAVTSATTLLYEAACPADGSEIEFGFTATKDEIRLYKPPTGDSGFVYVLTRKGP